MKKFTKISLIVAAVLLGIGILFCGIATMMGAGFNTMRRMARNGEFDTGNWHISDQGIYYGTSGADWEVNWNTGDGRDRFDENWLESSEAESDAEAGFVGENGIKQTYESSAVKDVVVDVDAAAIYVRPSKEAGSITVSLEKGKQKYYDCRLDGDTLRITYNTGHHYEADHNGYKGARLVITIPEETSFEDWNIDLGAAEMIFEKAGLNCKNLTVDIGAGRLEAKKLQVEELTDISIGAGEAILKAGTFKDMELECDLGNVEMEGTLAGSLDGSCSMGSMTIDLSGKKADYNYDLSCSMGDLEVNGNSYAGLDGEHKETNEGAVGTISLECDMGSIELNVR